MIILIAGMPRAGSMWTYNVARACIRSTGLQVLPEEPPINEEEVLREALTNTDKTENIYCIKTHEHVPLNFPIDRIICNYRDVRDAMISYMRFTHCTFEFGLHIAERMMSLTDHFFMASPNKLLKMHFDDIRKSNTAPQVGNISNFLGLDIPNRKIKAISDQFSRKKISGLVNRLNRINSEEADQATEPSRDNDYGAARNRDGSYRTYDKKSGFQSNHITATKDAEWKTLLTADEQEQLARLTNSWLVRHGFTI